MIITILIRNLLLTIIIELAISLILGIKEKKDINNIIIINCITNPILNIILLIIMYFISNNIIIYSLIFIFEIIVIYLEYLYYKNRIIFKNINILLFSIILNTISFMTGLIISFIL